MMKLHNGYIIFFVVALILVAPACSVKDDSPDPSGEFAIDVGNSEIPYLVINTSGRQILYEPRIPATLKIYERQALVQEQTIGIEYRGKTSYRLSDKKGFNIESIDATGEGMDVSFFGMPEEEDWRLVGHVVNLKEKYAWDQSLMYNHVGYELSRNIGKYASRTKFVEVELNGEYLGVYIFMEKLKRSDERINIRSLNATSTNLTGGYILTIDKSSPGDAAIGKPLAYFDNNWEDDARYTAAISFRSSFDIFGRPLGSAPFGPPYHAQMYLETYFMYEYPKAENITEAQKKYIADYITAFEASLLENDLNSANPAYLNFIGLDSFVDYFIITELCRNVDAYRLSTYLQKDRSGKLEMGPVWDMNIAFDEGGRIPMNKWVAQYNEVVSNDAWMVPFWWTRLLQSERFKSAVKVRWQALRGGALSDGQLTGLVDASAKHLKDNGAVQRNYAKWDKGIGINYDASIVRLKQFLTDRATWMDQTIGGW